MISIERRFVTATTSAFYADLSLLHPRNFGEVPLGAMEELHGRLLIFDDGITAEQLRTELQSFGQQWSTLKQSVADAYTVKEDNDSDQEQVGTTESTCKSCKDCPLCCYSS